MSILRHVSPPGKAGPSKVCADGEQPAAIGPFRYASEFTAHAATDPRLRRCRLAKDILALLAQASCRTGQCYRSLARMAEQLGTDRKAIRRAIATAEAFGYVRKELQEGRKCYTFFVPIDPKLRESRAPSHFGGHRASARFEGHQGIAASGGMIAPQVSCEEKREESRNASPPGFITDHAEPPKASPPTVLPSQAIAPLDVRAREALISALAVPDPRAINRAADLMARQLDGSTVYLGGFRQAVWDASRADPAKHPEILSAFDDASKLGQGRGRRFMAAVRAIVPRAGGPAGNVAAKPTPIPPGLERLLASLPEAHRRVALANRARVAGQVMGAMRA